MKEKIFFKETQQLNQVAYYRFLKKYGPTPPLFVYFRSFQTQI